MKRIGILHGRERSFPEAFVAEVNRRQAGVTAEPCAIEGARFDVPPPYDVVVDRISHEVPFYQTWLKQAALAGTRVINNPFWRVADDKYLGTCLAARAGIAVPRTTLLPQRAYIEDINAESLSNLRLVDWDGLLGYVGLPCILKPAFGGGWKAVSKCDSADELHRAYEKSGTQVMMAQEFIAWEAYARLICIGKRHIRIAPWDPTRAHHERYTHASFQYSSDLEARMLEQAQLLNELLGYDMNTVEFAIRDGVPFAIDFTNTAPDFDRGSLTGDAFDWVVTAMADLAVAQALEPPHPPVPRRWDALL